MTESWTGAGSAPSPWPTATSRSWSRRSCGPCLSARRAAPAFCPSGAAGPQALDGEEPTPRCYKPSGRASSPTCAAPPPQGAEVREPRPGSGWSLGRLAHRAEYLSWSCSPGPGPAERWLDEWRNATAASRPASFAARAWRLGDGDLHHVSYLRLGAEAFSDLWPACRGCHEALHLVWDASPAWRAMGREAASPV